MNFFKVLLCTFLMSMKSREMKISGKRMTEPKRPIIAKVLEAVYVTQLDCLSYS